MHKDRRNEDTCDCEGCQLGRLMEAAEAGEHGQLTGEPCDCPFCVLQRARTGMRPNAEQARGLLLFTRAIGAKIKEGVELLAMIAAVLGPDHAAEMTRFLGGRDDDPRLEELGEELRGLLKKKGLFGAGGQQNDWPDEGEVQPFDPTHLGPLMKA